MAVLLPVLFFLLFHSISGSYTYWSHDDNKHLWCPDNEECFSEATKMKVDHCCACFAKPIWELPFSNISYHSLAVEARDVQFKRTKIYNTTSYVKNSTVFRLSYINGYLRYFPENACDFNIVTIDVTKNMFHEIGNVSCFTNLDTLIMKDNLITFVSNATFKGMSKLRIVDLSYNIIKHIDLNVASNTGVFDFNFESNNLRQLDISNILIPNKTMCGVSYASNKRSIEITNIMNFQIVQDSPPICNNIDFSNVTSSRFVLEMISQNIDSKDIPEYVPCGQHRYEGSSSYCGCELAELFPLPFPDITRLYHKHIEEYICEAPASLSNLSLYDVYLNQTLRNKMTCDIKDYCHSRPKCHCTCTSQPSQDRIFVDCSNQSCIDLPDVLPDSKYPITLKINNNNIKTVKVKDYFSRVKIIDMAENPIDHLDNNIDVLKTASSIIIYNHTLKTLPKSIRNIHPDVFHFKTNGIPCNCENRWIGEWRKFKSASKQYPLYCSNYNNILIEDIVDTLSGCEELDTTLRWYILIVILLAVIALGIMGIANYFRFDFLIFKRQFLKNESKRTPHKWETDIYVSFDNDNDDVRYYVLRMLEPFLRQHKLTTYISCRDELPGTNYEDSVVENLRKSKNIVIVESTGMYNNCVRRMEYKLAWEYFINCDLKKMLILNFDLADYEKFQYKKTRALNRFDMTFLISDRKRSLDDKLLTTFNEPLITV